MKQAEKPSIERLYKSLKKDIAERLDTFRELGEHGSDRELWREMCFCTCTPQTNAHKSWQAVLDLDESDILVTGDVQKIAQILRENGVRFHNNKARSILENRAHFYPNTKKHITAFLEKEDAPDQLQKSVRGWGMKESAHFLRNIGYGEFRCILDRHILRCLVSYGVIDDVPASLSYAVYTAIDEKMKSFALEKKIPLPALDLVFWYEETGELFK